MDKFFIKVFGFSKSCIHFLKILVMFTILMLFFYWIQDLLGSFWAWTGFIKPVLDLFVEIGARITSGSTILLGAVFEYKFLIALVLLLLVYVFIDVLTFLVEKMEEMYFDLCRTIKKIEENKLNDSLKKQITKQEAKLKRYQIYVSTSVKKGIAHRDFSINLDEQNKIMLKFLMEKTMCNPTKKDDGYLFEFHNFEKIDSVLDSFNKLIQSEAPLDYIICVQVLGEDIPNELKQMETLKSLKILNKIVSFADTAYRYSFNNEKGYTVSQLGLFQKEDSTFEVHEYIKNIL